MEAYQEILRKKDVPQTGEVVRCKESGSLWRVMEREVWQKVEEDPVTGGNRLVSSIYLSFWLIQAGVPPRVGQMLGYLYNSSMEDFFQHWEVLNFEPGGLRPAREPDAEKNLRLN